MSVTLNMQAGFAATLAHWIARRAGGTLVVTLKMWR
jgi:hypothetical protein